MFVVFDLDGTLALTEHRAHHLRGDTKDWRAFYAACDKDEPCEPIIAVLRAMAGYGHRVEIWSGRSDEVYEKTRKWLIDHGISVKVMTRSASDHRPDTVLKAEWMRDRGRPDLVFEDRASMVAMYRAEGIVCCQAAPGDF